MAANQAATTPNNNTSNTTLTNGGYVLSSTAPSTIYTYPVGGGSIGTGSGYYGGGAGNITAGNVSISQWGAQIAASPDMSAVLQLNGKNADVVVNCISLFDILKTIPERLHILVPNSKIENEWDELKALGEQYRKLEAELEEKSRMWTALKNTE